MNSEMHVLSVPIQLRGCKKAAPAGHSKLTLEQLRTIRRVLGMLPTCCLASCYAHHLPAAAVPYLHM